MTPQEIDHALKNLSDERLIRLYLLLTVRLGLPVNALQDAIDRLECAVQELEGFQA